MARSVSKPASRSPLQQSGGSTLKIDAGHGPVPPTISEPASSGWLSNYYSRPTIMDRTNLFPLVASGHMVEQEQSCHGAMSGGSLEMAPSATTPSEPRLTHSQGCSRPC